VIDNAGTELAGGNRGVDRGHGHPDDGAFDVPGDTFAWCGAAVLLRAAYLDDIGGFDERLFLYSEDLDMSWRGRLAGWRYRYEPASVVHHAHAATTARRPEILRYYTLRNHLVVAARYAAPSAVVRGVFRSLGALALHAATDWRTASGRAGMRTRVRAFGGFVRMVPGIVRERRLRSRGAISAAGAGAS
jgi:GT2 family glycosyltransferase